MSLYQCAGCREMAAEDELIEVVEVRSGRVFWVHRPALGGPCFRSRVQNVDVHRIVPRPRPIEGEGPA